MNVRTSKKIRDKMLKGNNQVGNYRKNTLKKAWSLERKCTIRNYKWTCA